MLNELNIANLGIIENVTWQLDKGLNVITGETGAGKSLMVDAVELLLNGKTNEEVIRHGANEIRIEGVFNLSRNESLSQLRELLSQKDLAEEDDSLVISYQLRRNASAAARVNGHTIPKSLLHQIGRLLLDIHGQSEHLSLLDSKTHLNYLDSYARTLNLRNDFRAKTTALHKLEQELRTLEQNEKDRSRQEEFLRFQIDEINQANLHDNEDEDLKKEKEILSSVELLREYAGKVYQALYEDDTVRDSAPALDRLHEAGSALKKLSELDSSLKPQLDHIEELIATLTDTAHSIHAYSERLNPDPARLEEIESRMELIKGLKRKYGQNITDILEYQNKATSELENIVHYSDRHAQLEKSYSSLNQECGEMAYHLSQERLTAASRLVKDVKSELADLNMEQVQFEVAINQQSDLSGIPFPDGTCYAFNETGVDTVEFMVATNPGEPLKPLTRIASTGELSRFTLALKSALSEADNTPVLVFDEVDIGIGGRSGEIIGKKLWLLGRHRQVLCITHLPQIAAFADAQFCVRKTTNENRALSSIEKLNEQSRIKELAVMLAGPQFTDSALKNAREIIHRASMWKHDQQK